MISIKTDAIENALWGDHEFGNLHVNCQHLAKVVLYVDVETWSSDTDDNVDL